LYFCTCFTGTYTDSIRGEKTEVLLDLTTYGDLTGAHILQVLSLLASLVRKYKY
jgi:hypothetical protein